eukprot:TRINITY_DN916_c0_g1_i2.p1 TRINITY_DN916_c0_g1~~TRINITY_DN916_c0_g1_i2.p1  ORF type:complete len:506 (+),score=94.92 TRINITY_DN916_c0_g1_i2:595-2112(+)
MKVAFVILQLCLILCLFCVGATTSDDTPHLIVGTKITQPFVFYDDDNNLQGFSIDLWNGVAKEMGVTFEYKMFNTLQDLLNCLDVNNQTCNVSICSTTITEQRAEEVDFSTSMFDTGLTIMTHYQHPPNKSVVILQTIFSNLFLQVIGVLLLLIVGSAHIFYFLERRRGKSVIRYSYPRGGLEDAVWWAGSILISQGGDIAPKTLGGRLFNLLIFLIALTMSAIIGATLTASLTVSSLDGSKGIASINDLSGKTVGAVTGSTAAQFLANKDLITVNFPSITALEQNWQTSNQLDAIVYDFPVLKWYIETHTKIGELAGGLFQKQDYGITLPLRSQLTPQVNTALETLYNNGLYQVYFDNWFALGSSSSSEEINLLKTDNIALIVTYSIAGFLLLVIGIAFVKFAIRREVKRRSTLVKNYEVGGSSKPTSDSTTVSISSDSVMNSSSEAMVKKDVEMKTMDEVSVSSNDLRIMQEDIRALRQMFTEEISSLRQMLAEKNQTAENQV